MQSFNEYQDWTRETAIYPTEHAKAYTILGLANEAGEVAGKLKKSMRDGWTTDVERRAVTDELGDVLWYLARVADEYGYSLEDIAKDNVAKLSSRKERGVLKGSGDDR